MKKDMKHHDLTMVLLMSVASAISASAIAFFASAAGLFPGGFSGLSLLIIRLAQRYLNLSIPYFVLYIALNIPPTLLVFKYVGKRFTIFSLFQIVVSSVLVSLFESMNVPLFTDDMILLSVFGGIISGIGSSMALRLGASTGGTDFIAIYASFKKNNPTWNTILYANSAMLLVAGIFFGPTAALYSIIYQFVQTTVVQSQHNRFKLVTLHIITERPDAVCTKILSNTRHGITKLWGEGSFSHKPKALLYMVVNAFEVEDVVDSVLLVDPHAFIDISNSQRVIGNFYQKPMD